MRAPTPLPIARWSTGDVPPEQRFDFCASALSSSIVPLQIERRDVATFDSEMDVADLGLFSIIRQRGCPHRCYTDVRDIARAEARSFHLLVNVASSRDVGHRGRSRLAPGDAMLIAARANAAMRMLESPLFRRLTLQEIARRAGFSDASHFCRVIRARFGQTPSQVRRRGSS